MSSVRLPIPVVLLVSIAFAACSEPDVPVKLMVRPAAVELDAIGISRQLTAIVQNEKGKEVVGATVSWASADTNIARVSSAGTVTSVAPGTVEIKATAGTLSATATVTVRLVHPMFGAYSGQVQVGPVHQALPEPLVVIALDRLRNAVPGIEVTFTVIPAGSGTVSPPTAVTGRDGTASTVWTFGTKAGYYSVYATFPGAPVTATFSGTATPGPAAVVSKAGGDNQFAYRGTPLDTLVAIRVRDEFGNGVPGHPVRFVADAGNGVPDVAVATTDTSGLARTGWTMPGTIDTVTLKVESDAAGGSPLPGSPLFFSAVSHNLRITAVSPATVLDGESVTLDGSGFDPNPSANLVMIDGVEATVTAASPSQLSVTVPTYDCRPYRAAPVRVTAGGIPSSVVGITVTPASFLSLAPGQQHIVRNPADFCFQFRAESALEMYAIGVQSASEEPGNLTAVTLTGTIPATATAAAPTAASRATPGQATPAAAQDLRWFRRWARHRTVELAQREVDLTAFERASAGPPARSPSSHGPVVPASAGVGDTIPLRVIAGPGCNYAVDIRAAVRAKGDNAFFLEDLANPRPGYDTTDFEAFQYDFDDRIYPVLLREFGAPGDADGNGRVVVVVTREVNRLGAFAFTASCDLFPRDSTHFRASNEGEFFYVVAPDPAGSINHDTLPLDVAFSVMPSILAHEPVHIIQFTRRKAAGGGLFDIWLAEGQAMLGEEIVGHAMTGRSPGQNYGLDVVFGSPAEIAPWYLGHFATLSLYFGWDPFSGIPNGRALNAPHECTWLARKPPNTPNWPCVSGLEVYGPPWSLLRWLSDRFGPATAGGEPAIHQALIDNTLDGYALIESVIGTPMDSLLAQWAAMLYVDDRVSWLDEPLRLASWNLYDIYYGLGPAFQLTPEFIGFVNFNRVANVRAGSTYYAVLLGSPSPAMAIKARDSAGQILPAHMRYWVVRIR